jgi:GABA(A) receptor-associated protein
MYKSRISFEQRKKESTRITTKYSDRIPIICEPFDKTLPNLKKNKFLVPCDLTFGQFITVIRKQLKLESHQVVFIFCNEKLLNMGSFVSTIYFDHKDEDGFLYLQYTSEDTFG